MYHSPSHPPGFRWPSMCSCRRCGFLSGKGIAAASLAAILESRASKSPSSSSTRTSRRSRNDEPFQHGEVFVTEDGAETDLDLGHYERFSRPDAPEQQLHHRPDLRLGDQEGAPRRLPRRTVQVIRMSPMRSRRSSRAALATRKSRSSRSAARSGTSSRCPSRSSSADGVELGAHNTCYVHLTLVLSSRVQARSRPSPLSIR